MLTLHHLDIMEDVSPVELCQVRPDAYRNDESEDESFCVTRDTLPVVMTASSQQQLVLMHLPSDEEQQPVARAAYLETIAEETWDDLRSEDSEGSGGRWGWDGHSTDGASSVIHVASSALQLQHYPDDQRVSEGTLVSRQQAMDRWLEESIREVGEATLLEEQTFHRWAKKKKTRMTFSARFENSKVSRLHSHGRLVVFGIFCCREC